MGLGHGGHSPGQSSGGRSSQSPRGRGHGVRGAPHAARLPQSRSRERITGKGTEEQGARGSDLQVSDTPLLRGPGSGRGPRGPWLAWEGEQPHGTEGMCRC